MSKHKSISKQQRIVLWDKYNHKCAYCGCDLEYKNMQVDHVKSVYLHTDFHHDMTDDEMYDSENLLPSCRQCNFYKSTMPLNVFRERLTTTLMDNLRKQFNYKLAMKYGLIEEHIEPVKFYFESLEE